MKKFILFISISLVICSACNQKNDNVVIMGAIVPLTGTVATNGDIFKKGLEMGVEEVNSEGGIQLMINFEDCKSTAKDAQSAYKKLSGQGIQYYIGLGGQFIPGFASETNNSDKILFASAAPNSNLLQLTNRCFRLFPTVDMVTDKVTQFVVENNYNNVAIVYMQYEAYSMYFQAAKEKLIAAGKNVVFIEGYDPATKDFKGVVSKMASLDIDIVYTCGGGESSALFTRQLFSNPMTSGIPIIGDMNFSNPENLAIIGDIKSPIGAIDNYISEDFSKAFFTRYNQHANSFALYGYIIPFVMKETLSALPKNFSSHDVFEYIRTHTFETAGGSISFDSKTMEPHLNLVVNMISPNK